MVSRLPETTAAEFNAAVAAAKAAFPAWRATPVPARQRVMLKFQELIRANWVSKPKCSSIMLPIVEANKLITWVLTPC